MLCKYHCTPSPTARRVGWPLSGRWGRRFQPQTVSRPVIVNVLPSSGRWLPRSDLSTRSWGHHPLKFPLYQFTRHLCQTRYNHYLFQWFNLTSHSAQCYRSGCVNFFWMNTIFEFWQKHNQRFVVSGWPRHLSRYTMSSFLCSSRSNVQGNKVGPWRAQCQLKKPLQGLRQRQFKLLVGME